MRHRVQKKKLSRDKDHRKALLRNLARSMVLDDGIETTLTKAKVLRPYIEKIVTKAREKDDIRTKNVLTTRLAGSKEACKKLYSEIVPTYQDRMGGYTRILKQGFRDGDKAPLAKIEWVKDAIVEPTKKSRKKVASNEIEEANATPVDIPATDKQVEQAESAIEAKLTDVSVEENEKDEEVENSSEAQEVDTEDESSK